MNASQINAQANVAAYPIPWTSLLNRGLRPRRSRSLFATAIGGCNGPRMMRWLFCVSLWISSLLAIWITRGWIGLFLSGQVLSAGAFLFNGMAKKISAASSPKIESARQLEGIRDEL
jgi:hypothetical protein